MSSSELYFLNKSTNLSPAPGSVGVTVMYDFQQENKEILAH